MIKTKLIQDGILSFEDRIDDRINKFIKENNINVIDIKLSSVCDRLIALIIFEDKSE